MIFLNQCEKKIGLHIWDGGGIYHENKSKYLDPRALGFLQFRALRMARECICITID